MIAIVTGGNSGLGFETALDFVKKDIYTIITGRSENRLSNAVEKIKSQVVEARIEWMICDQSSLKSVLHFVEKFKEKNLPLDILVNNAGGFFDAPYFSEDGIEQHLAVNHLAHFLMTLLLLDNLRMAPRARIVSVSSYLHLTATGADWETLCYRENPGLFGYSNSKLANVLFTRELGKKLSQTNIKAYVTHPGYSKTEIVNKPKGFMGYVTPITSFLLATNAKTGAQAQIYAATDKSLDSRGDMSTVFIGPTIPLPLLPQTLESSPFNIRFVNDENSEKLWDWSIRIVKEKTGLDLINAI